jgi:hypothetical protein
MADGGSVLLPLIGYIYVYMEEFFTELAKNPPPPPPSATSSCSSCLFLFYPDLKGIFYKNQRINWKKT